MKGPVTIAQIEHHLGHCRVCYSRIALERALTERLRKSVRRDTPQRPQNRLHELIGGSP